MEPPKRLRFAEFWPIYVCEHLHPVNRWMHTIGTALSLSFFTVSILTARPWFLLGMPLVGYGFAWFGHFKVERNRPATFKHPFYSLIADHKMFVLTLLGQMPNEIEKAKSLLSQKMSQKK